MALQVLAMREAKLREWRWLKAALPHYDHIPCREFMADAG